ncbi:unnamed protein product [Blepharisma stoltei]|uniref:Uncharacterized protein n=1 Tax=Blepharisma stoltei TaxID=1481888 RepID=A0AAU9I969_9CILI|nr:unnamed protein product [Blepharisma stoltei]
MSRSLSPKRKLVEQSSKIQHEISQKYLIDSSASVFYKTNFFDTLKEPLNESIQRRVEQKRNPMSGMSLVIPNIEASKASQIGGIAQEFLRNTQKLNPRILEAWINNTVADAEQLDIPGCVIKPENRLPLIRYGIDRTSLLNAGLPPQEVDRLYRSLFVYSIGFYQMILKVLEHTDKKYTIVAGIWKVFAILLEYCCQLDYQMIITTLNLEKREELEQLEEEYKKQISQMEEHERQLLDNISQTRAQLLQVQRDLQKEIQKREELEDEIMQRGSGHEEEVAMRLQFESKLNQMFAKQRDMQTRMAQLIETINEQQRQIEMKTENLNKEKKRIGELSQHKIELEQEVKRLEEKIRQLEGLNNNLESRLTESFKKNEETSTQLSNFHTLYNESLNELAQKRIEIDNLKFEVEVTKVQVSKLESLIEELKNERELYTKRIAEIENSYNEECEKHQHFEQEYVRIKESDSMKTLELFKFREKSEKFEKLSHELEKERDKLKVQLESATEIAEEYKIQVKRAQERIEEMNRGRRIVEEQNENLTARLAERSEELKDLRTQYNENKGELERYKTRESELQTEIATLQIKIQSLEKQFETNKETLQEKIKSLTDILASEKKIRENWIYRYEEEQKIHSQTTKELMDAQDECNEGQLKINSLKSLAEERNTQLEKAKAKAQELLEEVLELRSQHEELGRKNKTLQMLLDAVDAENKAKLDELENEIEEIKVSHGIQTEILKMGIEDVWSQANFSYEKLGETAKNLEKTQKNLEITEKSLDNEKEQMEDLTERLENKMMEVEEYRHLVVEQCEKIVITSDKLEETATKFEELKKEHQDFIDLIPENLKNEADPFKILINEIEEKKAQIEEIEAIKAAMQDIEVQYDYEPEITDQNTQTEIGSSFFDKLTKPKTPGTSKSGSSQVNQGFFNSSRNNMNKDSSGFSLISDANEFPLRKKLEEENDIIKRASKATVISKDSNIREELTPVHLSSMYKHETSRSFTGEGEDSMEQTPRSGDVKLPSIGKKNPKPPSQPNPLILGGGPPDIKRYIKQAVSRRKNDVNFL